jgi:hypothetical protein
LAIWEHEGETPGKRYAYTVYPRDIPPGAHRLDPSDVEGSPVGYEWWDAASNEILKSCGDTGRDWE